jgi:NAD-dependent SIR2 family protein deacetylase
MQLCGPRQLFGSHCTSTKIPDDVSISDENTPVPSLGVADLPTCPKCKSLLRPDALLFGEEVRKEHINRVERFIAQGHLDLTLMVETCVAVYSAESYIQKARAAGARIAYVDIAPWCDDSAPPGFGLIFSRRCCRGYSKSTLRFL